MPPKRRRKTNTEWPTWAIVLIAIVIIVLAYLLYTISLGQIDVTPNSPKGESLPEKKEKAEAEHNRLMQKIAEQEELKKKLDKRFRRIYLFARIFFALLLAGYNIVLYLVFNIHTLGDLLNWNELLIIAFIAINFICYGTLANFNSLIRYFKNRTENWVYRKHIDLPEKIKQNKLQADKLVNDHLKS